MWHLVNGSVVDLVLGDSWILFYRSFAIVIYCKILSAKIIKGVLDNDSQECNKMDTQEIFGKFQIHKDRESE